MAWLRITGHDICDSGLCQVKRGGQNSDMFCCVVVPGQEGEPMRPIADTAPSAAPAIRVFPGVNLAALDALGGGFGAGVASRYR